MPKTLPDAKSAVHNPFIIGHHAEGAAFCDRRDEVERIAGALRDPSSRLLVYGDRRLGKSSTIQEAARLVRADGVPTVVVDLSVASNASAAAQRILSAVQREVGTRWRDVAINLLARVRSGVFSLQASTDALGQPSVSIQVTPGAVAQAGQLVTEVLDAVESELASRDATLSVCLDEFQRMERWYGDDISWQLKEMFERHRRIAYVLAGSEQTLVEQLLRNKKAGLWKVVDVLEMQPVPGAELVRWIVERSAATGVALDVIVAAAIVRLAGPRTRDIVQLARATWDWSRPHGVAAREAADEAMAMLVREQGALHQRQWDALTDSARAVLIAVATNPETPLLAARTLAEFSLGPKSTVSNTLDDLVAKELLFRRTGAGVSYAFDDPFFRRWVQENVMPDFVGG